MALTIKKIYEIFVREGIKEDPRRQAQVQSFLRSKRKTYNALKKREKSFFDKDELMNPYADTRILEGEPTRKVKRIIWRHNGVIYCAFLLSDFGGNI